MRTPDDSRRFPADVAEGMRMAVLVFVLGLIVAMADYLAVTQIATDPWGPLTSMAVGTTAGETTPSPPANPAGTGRDESAYGPE